MKGENKMKSASEISKLADGLKGHTSAIVKLDRDLDARIASIRDEGISEKKTEEKIKASREMALKQASEILAKANELHNVLSKEKTWWGDTEFLLSTLPVDNKFLLIAEAEKMSTSLLAMHIHHASANGEAAKFYVLSQEMNRRDVKPEGWTGIDFSTVNLPAQKEALALFSSAEAAFNESVITMRKINGTATAEALSIARLASGHANGG